MAIEKGLYELPVGMEDEPTDLNVEVILIDNPEDAGVEEDPMAGVPFDANLAEYMTDTALMKVSNELQEWIQADITSRKDWVDIFVEGLDVLGLRPEERTEPWDGACGVYSSLLSEAALRFQSETIIETFPAAGPVKTKLLGKETKEKEEAAARVRHDMNNELTERMVEYRPEHEKLLYSLGLAGSAFKKVYYCPTLKRQTAVYLPAEEVIVPYGASHIWSAERITHVMRKTENELFKLQAMGFYRDIDLGEPVPYRSDIEEKKADQEGHTIEQDDRYALYEVHVDMVLPEVDENEGEENEDDEKILARPYVITLEVGSGEILAIRRNWEEGGDEYTRNQYFVHYIYAPGFGFYGLGLIHIIGGYARAGTSLLRQLVDAGTLSNLPGGLKSRDLRVKGNDEPIGPGEWRDVDVPSGALKDHLIPLPYKEPSATLLQLLDNITNEGRRLGAISDMNISDMSAQAPVGTTLALLERTLKPMTAVQARVHYAMKQEFKLLKAIIAEFAPADYGYEPQYDTPPELLPARKADYAMVEVIPVSDPNSSTMAQRIVQYQAVMQLSEQAPQIYDLPQLHRQMIEVLGVKNADKLVPIKDDINPTDPVSENMGVLVGKPIKAFLHQDHDAHMATHMSFMQDPMIMGAIGQNPQAKAIMAALQAHIAEHLGFNYRKQMEEKLGVMLPPPDQKLPAEIEVQLSRLVADAGKQLAQAHQQQAAQQKAQQQAQDPVLQLEREKVKTQQAEVQRKAAKDKADIALRQNEQQRKRANDVVDAQIKTEEIAEDRRQTDLEAQRANVELANQRKELDDRVSLGVLKELSGAAREATKQTPEGSKE